MRETCRRGHRLGQGDTYADGSCRKCASIKRAYRTRQDALKREQPPQYLPGLRPYRKSRGFSAEAVAWEAGMEIMLYEKLEGCERMATYEQKVRIYRALLVLSEREREAVEAQREREARVVRAGL